MRFLQRWGIVVLLLSTFVVYIFESDKKYNYEVYEVKAGYGYRILKDRKIYIQQDFIPTLDSFRPFKNEDQATEAAQLIVRKLEGGKIPALSADEVSNILEE